MPIERKFFLGIGALVYSFQGKFSRDDEKMHRCWIRPIMDAGIVTLPDLPSTPEEIRQITLQMIPIDMKKSVDQWLAPHESEESEISWSAIEIDGIGVKRDGSRVGDPDPTVGDQFVITSIGPEWPLGRNVGRVFIAENTFQTYRSVIDSGPTKWPPMPYRRYEALTVVHSVTSDGFAKKRYAGFWGGNDRLCRCRHGQPAHDCESEDKENGSLQRKLFRRISRRVVVRS